jgi:hypothetical protein
VSVGSDVGETAPPQAGTTDASINAVNVNSQIPFLPCLPNIAASLPPRALAASADTPEGGGSCWSRTHSVWQLWAEVKQVSFSAAGQVTATAPTIVVGSGRLFPVWLEDELFPQNATIGWDGNAKVMDAAFRVTAGLRQVFAGRVSVLGRGLLPADFGRLKWPPSLHFAIFSYHERDRAMILLNASER